MADGRNETISHDTVTFITAIQHNNNIVDTSHIAIYASQHGLASKL